MSHKGELIAMALLYVFLIPACILLFLRTKKRGPMNANRKAGISDQNNDDSNPDSSAGEAPVKLTTLNIPVRFLLVLSLLFYVTACISPLKVDKSNDIGFDALTMGIFVFPMWIPNPLYFIGWTLAVKRRYQLAGTFGLLACIWSIVVVWVDFPNDWWVVDVDGSATIFWVLSMTTLVIACAFGMFRSRQSMLF